MLKTASRAALLGGVLLACGAAPALADSVVYIGEGDDVFVMQPDGSGKLKLTDGGNWHSPTQADDGTIAAVQGTGPIVVMQKDGKVLRTITTPEARSGDGGTFAPRPVDLSFSPDGSKIAYSYVAGSCPVASSCGTTQRSTFYTEANVTQATPHTTWGNQFSVSDPEWVGNDRTLVFGGAGSHVNVDTLDAGDYNHANWFNADGKDLGDGELARDGRRLALIFDYGANTQMLFMHGPGHPVDPTPACTTTEADPNYADPSWSPDSSSVAFQSSKGVEVLRFTSMTGSTCASTGPSTVVAAGGRTPDWGPAEPATARYVAPAAPAPPQPTVPAGPVRAPQPADGRRMVVKVAARQRLAKGLSVSCTPLVAGPCRAVATVKVGKRTYRSNVATKAPGAQRAATLRLAFAPKARTALRRALRKRTLVAQVKVTGPAGAVSTHAVKLTR
jgi:hypothetical protein